MPFYLTREHNRPPGPARDLPHNDRDMGRDLGEPGVMQRALEWESGQCNSSPGSTPDVPSVGDLQLLGVDEETCRADSESEHLLNQFLMI